MSLSHSIYFKEFLLSINLGCHLKPLMSWFKLTQYHTSHATILAKFYYPCCFALNKSFSQEFFLCLMSAYTNPASPFHGAYPNYFQLEPTPHSPPPTQALNWLPTKLISLYNLSYSALYMNYLCMCLFLHAPMPIMSILVSGSNFLILWTI